MKGKQYAVNLEDLDSAVVIDALILDDRTHTMDKYRLVPSICEVSRSEVA